MWFVRAAEAQLLASQTIKLPEEPPVQAFAALGLNSQPTTPAKSAASGLFGTPVRSKPIDFLRSPAAERIPAVNIAETEWDAALRTVAWRKTLLQQAQEEYDKAELRLAYYFYDLSPNGSRIPGGYQPERMVFRRSWEKPEKLVVPHPTCSFSRSAFTALFPATPIPTPAIAPQAPVAHVAAQAPLSTSQSNKTSEAPPVQAFAALGLGSHPTTPAKSDAVGIFEITFPRSPAAEQIPAVSNAETEWEASLRAVAWRKTLLHQAQNEYDKAVRAEKEKFKAYSETRMNLDQ
ncbi:hypothetical protein FRB90_010122 [Tulasnella sp. 427]|nr:hypothetical protein FRB90_010122 [Tulasnella sp. 427]